MEVGVDLPSPKTANRYKTVAETASILNNRMERLVLTKAGGCESISGHVETNI